MNEKELLEIIERTARDEQTFLNLSNKGLKSLPAEIGKLSKLAILDLRYNQLSSLPAEIGNLTNLKTLYLSHNLLSLLPAEIGKLANLKVLYLGGNKLSGLPAEIVQLKNLTKLVLFKNQLSGLHAQIGQLTNLKELSLLDNQLSGLPAELGQLTNLRFLDLSYNQLGSLPAEICKLTNLKMLHLSRNQFSSLPAEILKLTNLTELVLSGNQLGSLPAEIGKLSNLMAFVLSYNQLISLPMEIGKLSNLIGLDLSDNKISSLPAEMGRLTKLEMLGLEGNPLRSPPPDIVKQGTQAILSYLRELSLGEGLKWEAKLMVVGEAGVGKTELVKALKGDEFGGETATEGVLIRSLEVTHPKQPKVTMQLNLWDFGGQEIQHATHQFFYSERSLFVLVWNARENYLQAKLNDWLELIQARASVQADEKTGKVGWTVPVLLVATHCDLWKPDIPYEELKKQFPRIRFIGMMSISNKTPRRGITELRGKLAEAAADLPLMGNRWPADWQKVEDLLSERKTKKETRMKLDELWELMHLAGIRKESHNTLARILDATGKIRTFLDDEQLKENVVLDPQWLTNRIAKVLKNQDAEGKPICSHAVLNRKYWPIFWPEEKQDTQRMFVQMMRNFDLVYELEDTPDEGWLVVQLLPYQLSEADAKRIHELWSSFKNQPEIGMKFRLEQSIPPGIPTWFTAREHRFSLELHWRLGVLLADEPEKPRHLGLVQSFPEQRHVQLSVRGPMPHNFFALLRDGLELTLKRFPGLKIKRMVPCPGHKGKECEHEFEFENLEGFVERKQQYSQCQKTGEIITVNKLLYGIHESTTGEIAQSIEDLRSEMIRDLGVILSEEIRTRDELNAKLQKMLASLQDHAALLQRGFTVLFNAQQQLTESHCPNVFAVLPKDGQGWLAKNILGQKMILQLFCQAPGQWHPAVKGVKGGRYEIKQPAEFFKEMGPYILKLAKVIKYAAPVAGAAAGAFAGPIGAVMGAGFASRVADQTKLMEELATKLSERDYLDTELLDPDGGSAKAEQIEGAELRALRKLLDEEDKSQEWGGLKKILTPEGHYLWLCEEHAAEYKK